MSAQEHFGAEVTFKFLVLDVHVNLVPAQHVLVEEPFPAQLTHIGARPRLRAVLTEGVVEEPALPRG